jgi:hypothetical protein
MQPASDGGNGSASSTNLKRYGPLAVIAVLLLVVGGVVLAGGGDDSTDETSTTGDDDAGAQATDEIGAPEPYDRVPLTYNEAAEEGTEADYDWGDRCDTDTGQVKIPSVYAPPCVPVFDGDNGGETSPGVTADKIRVVRYVADPQSDLTALLSGMGVDETPEDQYQTFLDYLELSTSQVELYGREIEIVNFDATGTADDEVASRADAVTIAEDLEPFAVMGGPALDRGAFAEELATRKVLCMGCGLALPGEFTEKYAPYLWGTAPSAEQFLATLAAWVNKTDEIDLEGQDQDAATNAVFAGDPDFHDLERKVGVIHFEQDPPIFTALAEGTSAQVEGTYDIRETYLFDLTTMPTAAADLIAKMKDEDITTVMFLGDPLMPIYLTQQATQQEYFPEWIFTGTVLTDTNVMGRNYDQEQMGAAFGVSNLGAPTSQELQGAWQLYKWYFGEDAEPDSLAQYPVIAPGPARLALAFHMAGPDLTPETFRDGLFRVPPAGGGPTTPQVSYGNWGFFESTDYFGIDDTVEIWWDLDAVGEDEIGREGLGMWRRSHGATRFTAQDAPLPAPFVSDGAVTSFDELPADDQFPDYAPPSGSPAAG